MVLVVLFTLFFLVRTDLAAYLVVEPPPFLPFTIYYL